MIHVYETHGELTGTIEPENLIAAQAYLTYDHKGEPLNMEQYLYEPLRSVVAMLEWQLDGNGHAYKVRAICIRELTDDELRVLSSEVSGQNSDGLGEGFEQQDFAETDDEQDCAYCGGSAVYENNDCDDCDGCDGSGTVENYGMISFDWKTNELEWTKVR